MSHMKASVTKIFSKYSLIDPPFYRSTIESDGHSLDSMMASSVYR